MVITGFEDPAITMGEGRELELTTVTKERDEVNGLTHKTVESVQETSKMLSHLPSIPSKMKKRGRPKGQKIQACRI